MSTYRMEDGTVVDTAKAVQSWEEETFHDGKNHISRATGSQWAHQALYKTRKGRYYLEHTSAYQGSHPSAEWITPQQAAAWLLLNEHELPEDLEEIREEVSE